MVIGVWVGIVRELLKNAGPEADRDLPTLLDGLVFKDPDPAEEGRTLRGFAHLPIELQLTIWNMASLPGGMIGLRKEVLLQVINQWGYPDPDPGWKPPRLCCSERLVRFMLRTKKRAIHKWLCDGTYRGAYSASQARNSLLHTCRLSREVVVGTWKGIVQNIAVTEEDKFDRQNILNQLDKMSPQADPEANKVVTERGDFERFSALAIKIRTKIWKYASLPEGDFTLSSSLFNYIDTVRNISNRRYIRFLEQTSPLNMHKWVEAEESHLCNWKAVEGRKATLASKARNAMMGTNKAARKVALDTWSYILHNSRPARPIEWRDVQELPRPHPYWGWKCTDDGVLTVMRKGFYPPFTPSSLTFHCFGDLPAETREMVWRYAASPNGKLDLSGEIFYQHEYRYTRHGFWEVVSPPQIYRWQRFVPMGSKERENYLSRRDCVDTVKTREGLMGCCRGAREVVVGLWRESVKEARGSTHWRVEREIERGGGGRMRGGEMEEGMRGSVFEQVEGRRFARE